MKKYIVCFNEDYIKDARAYYGKDIDGDINENSTDWGIIDRPAFIGIYEAESEKKAIEKAHEENGWLYKGGFYVEQVI